MSVLKSSASALVALALASAALAPTLAAAQERDQRGPAGRGFERSGPPAAARPSMPAQTPSWQSRGPAANPQPSWSGRPTFSQGGKAPQPSRQPSSSGGWNGRPGWQGGDRERGDRGNGVNPAGQPTFGRPAWAQGGSLGTPGWSGRNPTYVDPARGNDGRANAGRDNEGRGANRGNGWQGNPGRPANTGGPWHADGRGNWNRDRDQEARRDNDGRWNRDRNNDGRWNRSWSQNTARDWRRDNDRDRDRWRDNRWGYNNDWNANRWGYNNGWNANRWGYNNGWNSNHWGYNNNWRRWDRDAWRRDNRYDWYRWRGRNRSTFSLGFYYAPWQDYSYSRFNIGVVIGQPFYAERYWIADPWAYHLPPAVGPYRWVRYYNDALLVDIYSGEVVDAVYDIFW